VQRKLTLMNVWTSFVLARTTSARSRKRSPSSSEQVAEGVALVDGTENAMSGIAEALRKTEALVTQIARSARTQAASIGELSGTVEQIDRATQKNAAMIEENSAASRSLALESEALSDIVDKFRATGGVAGSGSRGATTTLRPAGVSNLARSA